MLRSFAAKILKEAALAVVALNFPNYHISSFFQKTRHAANTYKVFCVCLFCVSFTFLFLSWSYFLRLQLAQAAPTRKPFKFNNYCNAKLEYFDNQMLVVAVFRMVFTFTDFESHLILFSWWRDKIS